MSRLIDTDGSPTHHLGLALGDAGCVVLNSLTYPDRRRSRSNDPHALALPSRLSEQPSSNWRRIESAPS
jgi:hypothetical protein